MVSNPREVTGHQPVGEKLPAFFPPLVKRFYTDVLNGRVTKFPPEQIAGLVADQFATTQPLIPLSSEEEARLFDYTSGHYERTFSDPIWEEIAGGVIHLSPGVHPKLGYGDHHRIFTGEYVAEMGNKLSLKPLSPTELEKLLTDPDIYRGVKTNYKASNGFIAGGTGVFIDGTRNLYDEKTEYRDSYGYTEATFRDMLRDVRVTQGKTPTDTLRGLDIGGSNGLAAHDAEELDDNLDMTNLTTRPLMGVWPLRGGHILVPAERMPKDYHERFDVIISNMAFRYMLFPDIVLRNSIHALNIGGIMNIGFSPAGSDLEHEEFVERVDRQFRWMAGLEKDGVVEFIPPTEDFYDAYQLWKDNREQDGYIPYGTIQLRKTREIEAA